MIIQFKRSEYLKYDYEIWVNGKLTDYRIAKDNGWYYVYEQGHILDRFDYYNKAKAFIEQRLMK